MDRHVGFPAQSFGKALDSAHLRARLLPFKSERAPHDHGIRIDFAGDGGYGRGRIAHRRDLERPER
jgi:hypothetical protein